MGHRDRCSSGWRIQAAWLPVLAVILSGPVPAWADETASEEAVAAEAVTEEHGASTWAAVVDAAALRPLYAIGTCAGFGFFVASTPFVAASGEYRTSWNIFVDEIATDAFRRPLGEL